jgi:hypothetical protein
MSRDRCEFRGIRIFFFAYAPVLGSFFVAGLGERLRSFPETASYELNSAVDSPGAAMSALEGEGRV